MDTNRAKDMKRILVRCMEEYPVSKDGTPSPNQDRGVVVSLPVDAKSVGSTDIR